MKGDDERAALALGVLLLAGYDTAAHLWGLSDEAVAALAGATAKEVAAWRQAQVTALPCS